MILHLAKDLVIFLTFCEDAKKRSKELLEKSLSCYFEMKKCPPDKVFYQPSGKPSFASGKRFLSISHCKDLYGVCISSKEVGLDIESLSEKRERVAEKYFTEEEKRLPFSLVWTGKEALSKISGKGLSVISKIEVKGDLALFQGEEYPLFTKEIRGYRVTVAEKR